MNVNALPMLAETVNTWTPPLISGPIPHGDMPGDKVQIGPEHIAKANTISPRWCLWLRSWPKTAGL